MTNAIRALFARFSKSTQETQEPLPCPCLLQVEMGEIKKPHSCPDCGRYYWGPSSEYGPAPPEPGPRMFMSFGSGASGAEIGAAISQTLMDVTAECTPR